MTTNESLAFWLTEWMMRNMAVERHVAYVISAIVCVIGVALLTAGLIRANRILFQKVIKRNELHLKFAESFLDFWFIILGVIFLGACFGYSRSLSRILLGSTGLIVAIIGFAAQSALGDVIAGLMMGVCRPFRLGDRVTLESSGISGTVRDMTIRHTVIHRFDGLYVVVPNSVMNKEVIHNDTYNSTLTACYLKFAISYDSDIETAMKIIHNAVISCRYAVEYVGDNPEYKRAAVYVTDFGESAVILRTTVWTKNADDNFLACSAIRIRVKKDFERFGIEIPYNYMNVVSREYKEPDTEDFEPQQGLASAKHSINDTEKKVRDFCRKNHVSKKETMHLNILAGEILEMMQSYTDADPDFQISLNGRICEMRLTCQTSLDKAAKYDLMSVSTTGKNAASTNLISTIREVFDGYRYGLNKTERWSLQSYEQNLRSGDVKAEDIGRSIIEKLADDVQIGIRNDRVELVVSKVLWSVDLV